MRRLPLLLLLGAFSAACVEEERAPYYEPIIGATQREVEDSSLDEAAPDAGDAHQAEPGMAGPDAGQDAAPAEPGTERPRVVANAGAFDPQRCYLYGGLRFEGLRGAFAVAHWSTPNDPRVGLTSVPARRALLGDGSLIYLDDDSVFRVFTPDPTSLTELEAGHYPAEPEANDPVLFDPECPDGSVLPTVYPSPHSYVYSCGSGLRFADGSEVEIADNTAIHTLYAVSEDDRALVLLRAGNLQVAVVDLRTGEYVEATPFPDPFETTGAARAADGGFLIVTGAGLPTASLWRVEIDGHAEELGSFPDSPAGSSVDGAGCLNTEGELMQGPRNGDLSYVVLRTIDGHSEVVYDTRDASEPPGALLPTGFIRGP